MIQVNHMSAHNKRSGFTLIEMVIAVAIFAVISALAFGGLNAVVNGQESLKNSTQQLKQLQLAFRYLERDLTHFINRPIRDNFGDLQGAIIGDENTVLTFSHSAWRNPANLVRSKIQRVTYEYADNTLTRHTWAHLDGAAPEESFDAKLLENVESITLRYLQGDNSWHTTWPPLNNSNQAILPPKTLEITIKYENWEEIKRLFVLPLTPIQQITPVSPS